MGKEEQDEELEVLASIFPDEISYISPTTFTILITLDLPSLKDDATLPPSLLLTTTYPPSYPSIAPDLSLSFPHGGTRPPHLSLPEDTPHLLSTLSTPINESLGTAMIFTLVTMLKESAESLITDRMDAVTEAEEKIKRREEEKEDEKFHGERVTRERFLSWREGFRKEIESKRVEEERREEEERKGKRGKEEGGRLTGRELWERGMVGKEAEVEVEGDEEEGVVGGVAGLKVEG